MASIEQVFGNKAVRGMLLNPSLTDPFALLALAFQLNPKEVSITKKTNYEIDEVPGFDAPIVTWVSGGATRIEFELFFDATQAAVDSNLTKVVSPLTGTLGAEAVLESFLRQQTNLIDEISGKDSIKPPPDCYFIYGLRWFKCKLLTAPIKEILHNKLLVPQRFTVPIQLIVLEEGTFHKINKLLRLALALQESVLGTLSTQLTVLF